MAALQKHLPQKSAEARKRDPGIETFLVDGIIVKSADTTLGERARYIVGATLALGPEPIRRYSTTSLWGATTADDSAEFVALSGNASIDTPTLAMSVAGKITTQGAASPRLSPLPKATELELDGAREAFRCAAAAVAPKRE
jgi:hypothetical protein